LQPLEHFAFLHELEMLFEAGLIRGGDLNNAIVIVEKTISPELKQKLQKIFNKPDIDVVKEGILNNLKVELCKRAGSPQVVGCDWRFSIDWNTV
jgi:UDP-3-O-[3-hydroxymyristoyl] N-acetylglucosamine deacetylase/3-hydroxyacyl-[acyl-carrier-protein] dehydratase